MTIQEIIKGTALDKLVAEILNRMHEDGPIFHTDLEYLSYIKKFHPKIFKRYEAKLISLMGLFYKTQKPKSAIEQVYSIFADSIEETTGKKFTPVQADAYKRIEERIYFSFSAPTSAGKSFLFRELIKKAKFDIIIVVPSRALVSEYINTVVRLVDKSVLVLQFIEVLNIKNTHRRVYIITPERGTELFKNLDKLNIELFLFDEAQLSEDGIRGMKFDSFVRRVDKLIPQAKKVFTHPFIENPEAQLIKHDFNIDSEAKSYKQNSVGKIYLSYEYKKYHYFSPFETRQKKIDSENDIVKEKLLAKGTILIYVSKTKIYDGVFISEFAEYVELCPKVRNREAKKYISRLKEFIGASDTNSDKHSVMIDMIEKGIVIHHGSMPLKARLLIEEFVNKGFARICFSTSTLTQGINMPFDIVWINNFQFRGSENQKILDLKNLIGRAGRSTEDINSFDYGYVVVEMKNIRLFKKRLKSSSTLSNFSLLDEETSNLDIDQIDIVEAIKEDTFNDELQLTNSQVERLRNADIDSDIKYILDTFLISAKPITSKDYYKLSKTERKKIKDAFKNIYVSHLRRNNLTKAEFAILSASIPILLWQIQGKSFSEIISLRYAFLSEKDARRAILQGVKSRELTNDQADTELSKLIIRYSPRAEPIPNAKLKPHGLYPLNTPVTKLEYDSLVYDTYDYIDKVISLSLKEPLSSAFLLYFEKTSDKRAIQLSNYIKFGTNDDLEIWLIRYGFSFDDIEWIKDYVEQIDENEILFKSSISELNKERTETIKRFIN